SAMVYFAWHDWHEIFIADPSSGKSIATGHFCDQATTENRLRWGNGPVPIAWRRFGGSIEKHEGGAVFATKGSGSIEPPAARRANLALDLGDRSHRQGPTKRIGDEFVSIVGTGLRPGIEPALA